MIFFGLECLYPTCNLHEDQRGHRNITRTWRGTSREKLYAELGWETLSSRRWSRRLTLFYKIINNLTPLYTKEPIPPLQQPNYSLRNQDVVGQIRARTEKFLSSFYPNCISEWQGRRERGRAPGQLVDAGPLLDSFNFRLNFIRKIQIVTIEIKSIRI